MNLTCVIINHLKMDSPQKHERSIKVLLFDTHSSELVYAHFGIWYVHLAEEYCVVGENA